MELVQEKGLPNETSAFEERFIEFNRLNGTSRSLVEIRLQN